MGMSNNLSFFNERLVYNFIIITKILYINDYSVLFVKKKYFILQNEDIIYFGYALYCYILPSMGKTWRTTEFLGDIKVVEIDEYLLQLDQQLKDLTKQIETLVNPDV